jgi:hypothetical protein
MASIISAGTTSGTALNMTADTSGQLQLATGASATTAVTIDTSQNVTTVGNTSLANSSGNVGIGGASVVSGEGKLNIASSTSPVSLHLFYGTNGDNYLTCGSSGIQVFRTGSTERMRIDTSGNVLVGTTTANARITSQSSNNNASSFALWCMNSSSTQLLKVRDDGLIETGTATNSPYNYTTGSAANTFINSSGQFQRSTSSLKYKQNVQDATHGLSDVLKLRPVTFTSKNDESGTIFGGLIAEEVHEAGLTEFVQYSEDGSPDALAYANMVSLLTKAIQEQQTIINELKSRIEALESK